MQEQAQATGQQPMQEDSMLDPLAEARQQQQMQQQQAPKLVPDFQSMSPAAPLTPPEAPLDALAGMQQEQPIQAADGAVAPQPWQQLLYPPMRDAAPMTPMDPSTPVAPLPPEQVMTEAPLEVVNVPDTPQMAPVTEFGTAAPVEQPYVDQLAAPQQQQQQQAPQDPRSGLGYNVGKGLAGVGDAVSSAFGGRGQAFQQIQAKEERDRLRADKKADQQTEAKQKSLQAQMKRQQDLEDFKMKEKYKADLKYKKEALEQDKKLKGTVEERISAMSSEGKKSTGMLTNALNAFAKAENRLMTDGYNIKDATVKTELQQHFDMIVNDVLRNESGAAISETEYERIRGMLPDLTDEAISPGVRQAKMQQIRDKIVLALGARGLSDKKELGSYLDKQVGFLKSVNPNSELLKDFRGDMKEDSAAGQLANMSDAELEAAAAQWEADNAR